MKNVCKLQALSQVWDQQQGAAQKALHNTLSPRATRPCVLQPLLGCCLRQGHVLGQAALPA